MVARERGRLRACGADMAAHCINDVATTGAEPLFLLDYVAANRLELEQVAELVEGAAEVCRAAGCALVGGETAEMPGVYREGELDFAATCVGIVDRDELIDGSRVHAGDVVVGFPSAGVHANGFSLVRSVLAEEDYNGDDLLAPTRLYLDDVRALRRETDVKALAHVTGGGIEGNLSRVLPEGLLRADRLELVGAPAGVRVARAARGRGGGATRLQPRDRVLRSRGGSRRTAGDRADRVIGVLASGEGTNLQALIDAGLPIVAVASNKAEARALERARAAGSPRRSSPTSSRWRPGSRSAACASSSSPATCGSCRRPFLERFDPIVNVHPSLLPSFPGLRAIEQALEAGVSETGVTVHLVDEGIDSGPVLRQEPVPVEPQETLVERIHAVEHRLLPEVVRELCAR